MKPENTNKEKNIARNQAPYVKPVKVNKNKTAILVDKNVEVIH